MFGFIRSHFPNARFEFVHSPLFSLVLFCRPTHHEKNRKGNNFYLDIIVFNLEVPLFTDVNPYPALFHSDGAHLSSLGNCIFLISLRVGGGWVLRLSLYMAIRPIQVRRMVWVRLFLFAALLPFWWESSLPYFSLMNLGPRTRGIKRQFAC